MTALLVLMVAVQLAHLVEEVGTGFRQRFPLGEMPRSLFITINAGIYLFAATMIALSIGDQPAWIPMAWLFAVAVVLNGIAHLGIMAVRRSYFPGGFTAAPLVAVGSWVVYELLGR